MFVHADHHQHALLGVFQAHVQVHPVRPQVHKALGVQRLALPDNVLVLPRRLQPADSARRQTLHFTAEQRAQRLIKRPGRDPFEVYSHGNTESTDFVLRRYGGSSAL